jgi:cell division protein FtsB
MTPVQLRRIKKNLDTLTREKEKKEKEIAELKHQKAMSERICQENQKVARNLNLDSLITKHIKQVSQ